MFSKSEFSHVSFVVAAVLGLSFATAAASQTPAAASDPFTLEDKFRYHLSRAVGARGLAETLVLSGFLEGTNSPREWGRTYEGYGKRFGSTLAFNATRNTIAFGLDSTLGEDPRYHPLREGGVWIRTKHAILGTFLTRRGTGEGQRFAVWRLGSNYGAAFLSREWLPDRLNTVGESLKTGTAQTGIDILVNIGAEFWPDRTPRMLHRKP